MTVLYREIIPQVTEMQSLFHDLETEKVKSLVYVDHRNDLVFVKLTYKDNRVSQFLAEHTKTVTRAFSFNLIYHSSEIKIREMVDKIYRDFIKSVHYNKSYYKGDK